MKRVLCFGLTLAMMMTLLMTSALAVDSEDTMEKTTTADKEQKALRLNDVVSTDDYKENIFNSILNSVDYYDAVEGSFVTTLWREDGEPTVVSYGSDINAQKSYQEISAEDEEYQVLVADGEKYTINAKARTRKVENVGYEEVSSRIKQTGSIYAASVAYETADNSDASAARVGTEDGVPVYYYRNDLTNCDYAAVSIFPQTLAFGLLTNLNDWEVVSTDTYLDRNVLIVEGTISDPIYSQKINSETFKLVVDAETGIVLEFVGYDDLGNETESIKTTDISIIKNTNGGSTDIAAFVDASLDNREVYKDTERTNFLDTDYVKKSAASTTSISKTIDNDTVDSDCYNSREGFLAYLNDSNYYNKDMRRTNSNSDTHYYGWHCNTVLDHEADDYIRVSLKVYLYSSTSKDPAASYGVYTVGMVGDSIFGMCTMDQATAPNGWNSFSRRWCLGNAGSITGIEMSPSGKGSTYTGADAVSYTISIA